jgi:hypothetical protein
LADAGPDLAILLRTPAIKNHPALAKLIYNYAVKIYDMPATDLICPARIGCKTTFLSINSLMVRTKNCEYSVLDPSTSYAGR